jgi:hypothetical protein
VEITTSLPCTSSWCGGQLGAGDRVILVQFPECKSLLKSIIFGDVIWYTFTCMFRIIVVTIFRVEEKANPASRLCQVTHKEYAADTFLICTWPKRTRHGDGCCTQRLHSVDTPVQGRTGVRSSEELECTMSSASVLTLPWHREGT